ncbi:acyltransferase [Paenarthrobacter sp. YJN-5]|uniref:acyltransferase family protein n=1 Tax=Paenarthrobacter sp. YJN-5 TaxID=2735316 RepID=UPI00187799CC|nr:acyltransferase [Paenarthrobacter sp. YJN-5]QOT15867.1 acyltransferase [Paenarthrobacter sp. YJN-5]
MTLGGSALRVRAAKKRHIANIDVVRIIALVAIVIGHVYTHNEFTDKLIQSWRLPIFFMLSGYFWSASRDLNAEACTRTKRLLVPYAWWLLILAVISLPARAIREPDSLGGALTGVIFGGSYAERPFTTFWFFTALFVATVLYRFLTELRTGVRLAVVGVGLLVNVLFGAELALAPFSVLSALGALVFIEAGRFVRTLSRGINSKTAAGLAAGCVAIAAVILLALPDFVPVDMKSGQFPPLAVLVALLICTALLLAAISVPEPTSKVARALETVTRPTLAVIILHPLVLWVLRPESGSLPLPAITAAALLLPWVAGLLIARTRLSYPLLGVPPAK